MKLDPKLGIPLAAVVELTAFCTRLLFEWSAFVLLMCVV